LKEPYPKGDSKILIEKFEPKLTDQILNVVFLWQQQATRGVVLHFSIEIKMKKAADLAELAVTLCVVWLFYITSPALPGP